MMGRSFGRLSRLILALALVAPASAEQHQLSGKEITEALTGHLFRHADVTQMVLQSFAAGGKTYYYEGSQQSEGQWQVRQGKYCAQWPPGKYWVCYKVVAEDGGLTFVSAHGSRYPVTRAD